MFEMSQAATRYVNVSENNNVLATMLKSYRLPRERKSKTMSDNVLAHMLKPYRLLREQNDLTHQLPHGQNDLCNKRAHLRTSAKYENANVRGRCLTDTYQIA